MKEAFQKEYKQRSDIYKARITQWNAGSSITRINKPTNITRARELGYKAKEGILMARVKVRGGKSKREAPDGGRKPSKSGRFFSRAKSLQAIAEERAATRFSNCEVLNSYFIGAAGTDKFYEIILLDRSNKAIQNSPQYKSILAQRGRAYRGMTHQGRKHRGLAHKGYGTIKLRPSKRTNNMA
jgi:large subunit ribosomal protein L15e